MFDFLLGHSFVCAGHDLDEFGRRSCYQRVAVYNTSYLLFLEFLKTKTTSGAAVWPAALQPLVAICAGWYASQMLGHSLGLGRTTQVFFPL